MVKGIEIGSSNNNSLASATPQQSGQTQLTYRQLGPGDSAPWFHQRSSSNPRYAFDTAAGRWIVLLFHVTASDDVGQASAALAAQHKDVFNDEFASLFIVSQDPRDESDQKVKESLPGVRVFWDFDAKIAHAYGIVPQEPVPNGQVPARRMWMILDPTLRVHHIVPFEPDGSDRDALIAFMRQLPKPDHFAGPLLQAPILYLPNVFEPELCQRLVAMHESDGGEESGFMREIEGKTELIVDASHKRRRDLLVSDPALLTILQNRVLRHIVPEIRKVHQFEATRMERYLIGCYRAEDKGHFRPHRDNTTSGTAHRRFAVSINLNADFDGGEIGFPEYGSRTFKPAPGSAVVFSCSLLHAVSPVTRGQRYAFLPFLYDDAAAALREANNSRLGQSVGAYSQT